MTPRRWAVGLCRGQSQETTAGQVHVCVRDDCGRGPSSLAMVLASESNKQASPVTRDGSTFSAFCDASSCYTTVACSVDESVMSRLRRCVQGALSREQAATRGLTRPNPCLLPFSTRQVNTSTASNPDC